MRYAVAAMIFVLAGVLFFWQFSQLEEPALAPAPVPVIPAGGNPFGEGSETMGEDGSIGESELALHNTEGDCWIGYKGIVYNITDWLPRHPGSAEAIAPYCGTSEEFAAAFNEQHGTRQEKRLEKEGEIEGQLSE